MQDLSWAEEIFGERNVVDLPGYRIIIKGIKIGTKTQDITQGLRVKGFEARQVRFLGSKNPLDPKTTSQTAMAIFDTPEEANRLISNGLIWNYEFYRCEAFCDAARPRQCYTCWNFH